MESVNKPKKNTEDINEEKEDDIIDYTKEIEYALNVDNNKRNIDNEYDGNDLITMHQKRSMRRSEQSIINYHKMKRNAAKHFDFIKKEGDYNVERYTPWWESNV